MVASCRRCGAVSLSSLRFVLVVAVLSFAPSIHAFSMFLRRVPLSRNTLTTVSSSSSSLLLLTRTRTTVVTSLVHRRYQQQQQQKSTWRISSTLLQVTTSTSSSSSNTSDGSQRNMSIMSNQELVQRRINASREKRQARVQSNQEQQARNMRLKQMIHTDSKEGGSDKSAFAVPNLYAIKVSVDQELRKELMLNGREKRGRVFIESGTDGCQTMRGLKQEMHSFFRCLRKSTYVLQGSLPVGEFRKRRTQCSNGVAVYCCCCCCCCNCYTT